MKPKAPGAAQVERGESMLSILRAAADKAEDLLVGRRKVTIKVFIAIRSSGITFVRRHRIDKIPKGWILPSILLVSPIFGHSSMSPAVAHAERAISADVRCIRAGRAEEECKMKFALFATALATAAAAQK